MSADPRSPYTTSPAGCRLPTRRLAVFFLSCLAAAGTWAEADPVKGKGTWTLYYVYEATGEEASGGASVTVLTVKGEKLRVRVSPAVLRKANMEGTAAGTDPKDGKRYVSSFVRLGLWQDLPDGWEGQGNRSNPLTSYRSVAADQRFHRYGSRIFVPELAGVEIPAWKEPHDGYLWVADSGGGIKGRMRFDLFVGRKENYDWIMETEDQKGRWRLPVEVERLPSAPAGHSPGTAKGLRKILEGLGRLDEDDDDVTAALTAFQRQHRHIPAPEYGSAKGAVTLWYLTQAARKVAGGEPYDAEVAEKRPCECAK